jgi:hypothetical protein
MPGWGGTINRPYIRRILEYPDSLDRPELYVHDMEERAAGRRRGQTSECELEPEAHEPLPPAPTELEVSEPDEPLLAVEPGQEG